MASQPAPMKASSPAGSSSKAAKTSTTATAGSAAAAAAAQQTAPPLPPATHLGESSATLPHKTAKSDTSTSSTALTCTDNSQPYYTMPIPGIHDGEAYFCNMYTPHVSRFFYSNVAQNPHGGNVVYIKSHKSAQRNMALQFGTLDAPMRAPFGLSLYDPAKHGKRAGGAAGGGSKTGGGQKGGDSAGANGGNAASGANNGGVPSADDKKRMNLSLVIEDASIEAFLRATDEKNKEQAVQCYPEWFNDTVTTDLTERKVVVRKMYKPLIVPPKAPSDGDPERDLKPTFRTKVVLDNNKEGKGRTEIMIKVGEDADGPVCVPGTWQDMFEKKNMRVVVIAENRGLWFMGGNTFGPNFVCTRVMILPGQDRVASEFIGFKPKMQSAVPEAASAVASSVSTGAPPADNDIQALIRDARPEMPVL